MTDLTGAEIGRYHIIEPLGQGGMAAVYKALDTTLEREVALKVIRVEEFAPAVLEKVLQRFEREAKTLARLTHSHIVPIIDYGQHNGVPYLVMPYFRGGTLRERLGRPLEEGEAARLLLPLADALGYAHRKGVLHRDIKPANILLNEEGQPMLTDFGIAKLLDAREGQTLTGTGVGIGTPEYMSPEQGMGKEVDARADVYALGVVLFELVTGKKPYSADTPMAVVVQHLHDPLPRPRDLNPRVSAACEQVLFKALAKQPEHRYADMEAFRAALAGLAAGERAVQPPAAPLAMDMPAAEQTTELTAAGLTVELGTGLRPPEAPRVEAPAPETRRVEPTQAAPFRTDKPLVVQPPLEQEKSRAWIGLIILAALITLGVCFIPGGPLSNLLNDIPTSIPTPLIVEPPSAEPTFVLAPQPTATQDPSKPPACTTSGERWVNPIDSSEMVCVPAGEFWMGAPDNDINDASGDEKPGRIVYLDAYWMDRYEVTNTQFSSFVTETGYITDAEKVGWSYAFNGSSWEKLSGASWLLPKWNRVSLFNREAHPVVHMSWNDATAYCSWAGEGLPSEAQWEKAARGRDGRRFPWGNQDLTSDFANYDVYQNNQGDTSVIGSYPIGASPYGAEDLIGNVEEWTADWYSDSYYLTAPSSNPTGPSTGTNRSVRGGSFASNNPRSLWGRGWRDPFETYDWSGFRCSIALE